MARYKEGERVVVLATGEVEVVDIDANGWYPPIHTKGGGMYTHEDVRPFEPGKDDHRLETKA